MAKTLTVTDKETGKKYTLEFTRESEQMMERTGFVAAEVLEKPMTMLPAMWAGAFIAHHSGINDSVVKRIFDQMKDKKDLVNALSAMYSEPMEAMMADPEGEEGDEGNTGWKANW